MTVPLQRLSATQAYRQSLEVPAFESEHDWPLDASQWGTITAGGGAVSHDAQRSAHVLSVSSANGDRVVLRSHARPRACAGRSRSVLIVGHCDAAPQANQVKRWGLFDDNGGFFFELLGEQLSAVRRSNVSGSVVDSKVQREQWTVTSGSTATSTGSTPYDLTKTHVYEIREAWPNGDAIFLIDGKPVHQIDTDGSIIGPAHKTARLPVAVEVANVSSAYAHAFNFIAASVSVEGVLPAKTFSAEGNATLTAEVPLLSIQPATTFGSQANLGEIIADTLTTICDKQCRFRWLVNATITGGSWSAHPDSASFSRVNTGGSVSGGRVAGIYVADAGVSASDLAAILPALRVQADGTTQDVLTLTATSIDGSAVSARAAVTWKEIR